MQTPKTELTQEEFDELFHTEKYYEGPARFEYPEPGKSIAIPLCSRPPKEEFILDVSRSCIKLTKNTFQNRARSVIVLARLDIDGPPHRNPDGEEIPGTHIHVYRPKFGDKWAMIPPENFTGFSNLINCLHNFMEYCKIVKKPSITLQGRLF